MNKERLTSHSATQIRQLMVDADSELSAIAHGRPPTGDVELLRIAHAIREAYEDPRFQKAMVRLAMELNELESGEAS